MKKIMLFVLLALVFPLLFISISYPAHAQISPTPTPTMELQYWEVFPVKILDRGTYKGVVRQVYVRDRISTTGPVMGYLNPKTVWQCDVRVIVKESETDLDPDVWCKFAGQGTTTRLVDAYYIPMYYNGTCYTDPCK